MPVIISSDNRAYALVLPVALKVRFREGALYEIHNMLFLSIAILITVVFISTRSVY